MIDLLVSEDLATRQPDGVCGHAELAPEIATVRDRYAKFAAQRAHGNQLGPSLDLKPPTRNAEGASFKHMMFLSISASESVKGAAQNDQKKEVLSFGG